jgi:diguanylate cyclase (GGDEF)-like protein
MMGSQAPFRYVRLRWLLVLTVLVAVTPVFALQLYRLQSASQAALADAQARAASLAHAAADDHAELIEKAERLLELLRSLPAVRYATSECSQILMGIQGINPWITTILVTDNNGLVRCHGRPGLVPENLTIGDRAHFRDAVSTRGFATSDVVVGRFVVKPLVPAALPAFDVRGNLESVISLGIDLQWVNQVAAQASAKFGGVLLAIDRRGGIIAEQPPIFPGGPGEDQHKNPLVRAILSAESPTFEATDPSGEQRIFGIARLSDSGVTIAVGLLRSEVLGAIDKRFWTDLLLLMLVATGSIGAAMLFAEFGVLRGVRALKTAAQRLKAGKIGLRVNLPSFVAGELHDLAATYNAMTAEFERLAYLDRLTGLPNRRYLERQIVDRIAGGRNRAQAVLAIDLDGFKPVNDTHGHAIGDRVLTAVARRIVSVVDGRGILARVGGDEFVAIMPLKDGQERAQARAIAEEIRNALDADPVELDGLSFSLGCSVGVAIVPEDAKSLAGAIVVADAALYEAKRAGRNRVVDNAPPIIAIDTLAEGVTLQPHWACPEMTEPH